MGMTKLVLMSVLAIYFVIIGTFLSAMGLSYNQSIHQISGFGINIITGFNLLPAFLQAIFIIIPSIIIILILLTFFIPTLVIF